MCRIELATNTITAESRIGIHKELMGTIDPPQERSVSRKAPSLELAGSLRSAGGASQMDVPTRQSYTMAVVSARSRPLQDQGTKGKRSRTARRVTKLVVLAIPDANRQSMWTLFTPIAFRFKSKLIPNQILVASHLMTSYPASSLWLQEVAGPSVRPPKPSESPPQSPPSALASSLPTPLP